MRAHRLMFFAAALVACGDLEVKPDSASGPDFERAGAQQLFLDKLVDDYLDAEAGDSTDWKYFKIRSRGILELTIYWDNKNVKSEIEVRDRFGVLIDSRSHKPELEKDRLDLRVEPGTHFLRLYSAKGASVYTMEAKFQAFDHKAETDVIPEAEPIGGDLLGDPLPMEDPIPMAADARPRPARRGGARPAPPTPRPAAAPSGGIRGTIVRLTPGPQKKGTVLTINRGVDDGLARGQTGAILDDNGSPLTGGSFTVTNVGKKRSSAKTNIPPGVIAHRRGVVVYAQ